MNTQSFKMPHACRDGDLTGRLRCPGAAVIIKDLAVHSLVFIKDDVFKWELHKLPSVQF